MPALRWSLRPRMCGRRGPTHRVRRARGRSPIHCWCEGCWSDPAAQSMSWPSTSRSWTWECGPSPETFA